jgi:archaellum component FlaC
MLNGIPGKWNYTWQQQNDPIIREQIKKDSKDIADTYTVLYELIKRDIVPYMETKQHEISSKKEIEYYHNQMEKLERDIKMYEQSINDTRKTLCEYAEKALKLQQPPTLTKFD